MSDAAIVATTALSRGIERFQNMETPTTWDIVKTVVESVGEGFLAAKAAEMGRSPNFSPIGSDFPADGNYDLPGATSLNFADPASYTQANSYAVADDVALQGYGEGTDGYDTPPPLEPLPEPEIAVTGGGTDPVIDIQRDVPAPNFGLTGQVLRAYDPYAENQRLQQSWIVRPQLDDGSNEED